MRKSKCKKKDLHVLSGFISPILWPHLTNGQIKVKPFLKSLIEKLQQCELLSENYQDTGGESFKIPYDFALGIIKRVPI